MIELILSEVICAVISTVIVVVALRKKFQNGFALVNCGLVLFWLLLVLPVFLDALIGMPRYNNCPGFFLASRSAATIAAYSVFMLVVPAVLLIGSKWTVVPLNEGTSLEEFTIKVRGFGKRYHYLFLTLLLLPLICLLVAPDFDFYRTYTIQSRGIRSKPIQVQSFHAVLQLLCHVAILASAIFLVQSKLFFQRLVSLIPIWLYTAWIIGKRSAVAEILAMIIISAVVVGKLGRGQLFFLILIFGVFLGVFSNWYQSAARNIGFRDSGWELVYENCRIDFFRDDTAKLAIYKALNPNEEQILDSCGESLWIYLTLPMPRSLWRDKPVSYGMSLACASMNWSRQQIGWGMTTSILDEAVANTGFFGFLLGPILLLGIAARGAKKEDVVVSLITVVVIILSMVQHLSAWMPIFLIWLTITSLRTYKQVT